MRSLGIDGADAAGLTGACAKAWPYFAKGCSLAGKGVRQSLLGTSRRRDARRQVSYNGRPLYYYVGDKKPGQVLCQNVDEFGAPGWSSARTVARCVSCPLSRYGTRSWGEGSALGASSLLRDGTSSR
jgi:hypothetical protein